MFVGGEFYNDARWMRDKPTITTEGLTFLNGGKACLIVISDHLREHGIEKVLLPSYLCPTIVNTLERCGITCDYYQVNPDLSIDLHDLERKAACQRVVYFINYFGFQQPPAVQRYLSELRQNGIILIEDNAQACFVDPLIGTFAFNSIRKLAAYDGGYLTTSVNVMPYVQKYQNRPNRRLAVIREYRKRLADYLFQNTDDYDELVDLYERAECYYESDMIVEGDSHEQQQIERLDWEGIKQARRENYVYLLNAISGITELSPIFPTLQADNMPMGLPVYVSGDSRDRLFDTLGNVGIGLTIHWDGLLRDPRLNGNAVAVDMASRMLTLVIDQRTSRKQMDYMVQVIVKSIRRANSSE